MQRNKKDYDQIAVQDLHAKMEEIYDAASIPDAKRTLFLLENLIRNINYDELKKRPAYAASFADNVSHLADRFYSRDTRIVYGMLLEKLDKFDDALKQYEIERARRPTSWRAYLYAAHIEMKREHHQAAQDILLQMFRKISRDYIPNGAAPSEKQKGNLYDMLAAVSIYLKGSPEIIETWKASAENVRSTLKEYQKAIACEQKKSASLSPAQTYPGTNKRRKAARKQAASQIISAQEVVRPAVTNEKKSDGFYATLHRIGYALGQASQDFERAVYGSRPDVLDENQPRRLNKRS